MLSAPSYAGVTFYGGDDYLPQTYSDSTGVLEEFSISNPNSQLYSPPASSSERLPPNYINREVPEPETWILTLVGFGIVGAAVRRRRVATS